MSEKKVTIIATLLIFNFFCAASADASTFEKPTRKQILSATIKTIPGDLTGIVKFPFKNPKISIPIIATTIGLIAVDRETTKFVQKNINTSLTWTPPSPMDDYMLAGLGALYAGGSLFNSSVNQVAALAALKSVGYSVLITQIGLKTLFGRLRPNPNLSGNGPTSPPYSNNPWDFFQLNRLSLFNKKTDSSMPSFHFTMYFAVGTALSQTYNSYWPYLVTAAGLLPNFSSHHHWVSDMFAGASLGVLIGYITANHLKNSLNQGNQSSGTLMPMIIKNGVALNYSICFA